MFFFRLSICFLVIFSAYGKPFDSIRKTWVHFGFIWFDQYYLSIKNKDSPKDSTMTTIILQATTRHHHHRHLHQCQWIHTVTEHARRSPIARTYCTISGPSRRSTALAGCHNPSGPVWNNTRIRFVSTSKDIVTRIILSVDLVLLRRKRSAACQYPNANIWPIYSNMSMTYTATSTGSEMHYKFCGISSPNSS